MDTKKLDWEKLVVGQEVTMKCGPYGGRGKVAKITPSCIEVEWLPTPAEVAWREHNERRGWKYEYGCVSSFNKDGLGRDGAGAWDMGGAPYLIEGSPAEETAALNKQRIEDYCEEWGEEIKRLGHQSLTPEEHGEFNKRWDAEHPLLKGWDGK